jgi:hypothetical protein
VHPSAEHVYLYFLHRALFRATSSFSVANDRFIFVLLSPSVTFTTSLLVAAADVARVEVVARRRFEVVADVFFFFASFAAAAAAAAAAASAFLSWLSL